MSQSQSQLRWRRHTVAPIGIEIDALDGPVIAEGSEPGFRYFVQSLAPVQIAARTGKGQDLASWRRIYGAPRRATFGDEAPATLCGLAARRQEVMVEAEPASGGFAGDAGRVVERDATDPPTVHVALAAMWRGEPLLVVWSIERDQRARYSDDEAHFFASVRCP